MTQSTGSFEQFWHQLQQTGIPKNWQSNLTITSQTYAVKDNNASEEGSIEFHDSLTSLTGFASLELLGEGGMGIVQLAQQNDLYRQVALKKIKPEYHSSETVKGLVHEARITGALQHPNVMPVYALGKDEEGMPVMVMKRIEGCSWKTLLKDPQHPAWKEQHKLHGLPPLARNLEILREVCNAIHFAHNKGVLHRDIKPSNVMLGDYGEVIVLDWGIALPLPHAPEHLQDHPFQGQANRLYGTPAYMAPEMAIEEETLGPETDVYLLGTTLHEILTGQPRHKGGTLKEVLFSVFSEMKYPYSKELPQRLVDICLKATATNPSDRYPDAVSFQEDLSDYLQHKDSIALTQSAQATLEQFKVDLNRLEALEQQSPHPTELDEWESKQSTLQTHFTTCQMAYKNALQIWPENQQAAQDLQKAVSLMFFRAIHTQNLELARGLFKELPESTPSHQEALENLSKKLVEQKAKAREIQRMASDVDFGVSAKQRGFLLNVMGIVLTLLFFSIVWRLGIKGEQPTYKRSILSLSALIVLLGVPAFILRKKLLANKINLFFWFSFASIIAAGMLSRFSGWLLELPIQRMLQYDLLLIALVGSFNALLIHPAIWISVIGTAIAFLFASIVPVQVYYLLAAMLLYNWLVLFLLFRNSKRLREPVHIPQVSKAHPQKSPQQ